MGTCIYCKAQDKPFNREHVMPQAFGTFEPESAILYDCVCADCNNYFGRTLELPLSRDSTEALLRLRFGIKPASEARDLLYRNLELKVGQPGPWLGATVVLEPDRTDGNVEPVTLPQAAFRWKGESEWAWLLERDFDASKLAAYKSPIPGTLEIRVIAPTDADQLRVVEKLKTYGIKFVKQGAIKQPMTEDGNILIQIAAQVDHTVFRAIAKIAFNYAAWVHGANFVLHSDFDDLRHYIRHGDPPAYGTAVVPFKTPILGDDLPGLRQTHGHLINFNWNRTQMGFLAQVSLFNAMTYHVLFCTTYSGIWHDDMRRGHHFDIKSRTIEPLTSTSVIPGLLRSIRATANPAK
jgi:hypothetical protein